MFLILEVAMRRIACLLAGFMLAAAFPAAAQDRAAAPDVAKESIEVVFSDSISQALERVNHVERILEERFRKFRHTQRSHRSAGVFRFSRTLTDGTRWANETLIPELENYTVVNLMKALTADNLARAVPDFEGRILYRINRLKIENHDVSFLNGPSSYMTGEVVAHGPDGEVIGAYDVSANLVVNPTIDREYTGPEYAFFQTDPTQRVGPTAAYFVEKALERVWPDKEDEIHGPIIIRVSGPDERVLQ